jgi:hypothetical protein
MTRPRIIRSRIQPRALTATVSIREALNDPALLGQAVEGESWEAWKVLLIAALGESLTSDEREIFKQLTGRQHEPNHRVEEFAAVVGRRGGKSRALATLATYIAGLCQHRLAPGETGVVLCIAPDQRQAAIVLEYCAATFQQSPILRQLVVRQTDITRAWLAGGLFSGRRVLPRSAYRCKEEARS